MNRYEVIPNQHWINSKTGMKVSPYGACPWTSATDALNWAAVNNGYTIKDNKNGTIGGYQSCPTGSSKEHATIVAAGLNQVYNQRMAMLACKIV